MTTHWTVLGCRAGAPAAGSAATGHLLRTAGLTLLIDCGPGVVLELSRTPWIDRLDGIIISHTHADHCADLLALAYYRRFPTPCRPLPIWGPPDVRRIMSGLDDLFGIPSLPSLASPLQDSFDFRPVAPTDGFRVGSLVVETVATQHPIPTLALRFPTIGITYTADGAYTPTLAAFAQGSRLLVAEATYLAASPPLLDNHGHLTGALAGQLAQEAGARHLLLTHFANLGERAQIATAAAAHFTGSLHLAKPGLVLSIPAGET